MDDMIVIGTVAGRPLQEACKKVLHSAAKEREKMMKDRQVCGLMVELVNRHTCVPAKRAWDAAVVLEALDAEAKRALWPVTKGKLREAWEAWGLNPVGAAEPPVAPPEPEAAVLIPVGPAMAQGAPVELQLIPQSPALRAAPPTAPTAVPPPPTPPASPPAQTTAAAASLAPLDSREVGHSAVVDVADDEPKTARSEMAEAIVEGFSKVAASMRPAGFPPSNGADETAPGTLTAMEVAEAMATWRPISERDLWSPEYHGLQQDIKIAYGELVFHVSMAAAGGPVPENRLPGFGATSHPIPPEVASAGRILGALSYLGQHEAARAVTHLRVEGYAAAVQEAHARWQAAQGMDAHALPVAETLAVAFDWPGQASALIPTKDYTPGWAQWGVVAALRLTPEFAARDLARRYANRLLPGFEAAVHGWLTRRTAPQRVASPYRWEAAGDAAAAAVGANPYAAGFGAPAGAWGPGRVGPQPARAPYKSTLGPTAAGSAARAPAAVGAATRPRSWEVEGPPSKSQPMARAGQPRSAPAGYRQCACGGRVRGEHSECYTCWSRAGTCTAAGCSAPAPVGNRCSACCRRQVR